MARSIKKGPYVQAKLESKVENMNEGKAKKNGDENLEPQKHHYTGFCRTYVCCSQRE